MYGSMYQMQLTKTTFNIPTALLQTVKQHALEENTSVTKLVITGLQQLLAGQTRSQASLTEFITALPQKPPLTRQSQDKIYSSKLEKKYGSHLS